MSIDVPAAQLVAFLLAMTRAGAWLAVTPPLNTRSVPAVVKAGLAAALALPVAGHPAATDPPLELAPLLTATLTQAAVGLALGFLGLVVLSALRSAGELIDLFGGFSLATAYDPLSLTNNSVFGRFHQLLMTTLLFASGGYLLLVRGFLATYDVIPLDRSISVHTLTSIVVHDVGSLFVAALEVAAPLLAASFLADLALGLLSRTAPSLNVFSLGFPVKIGLTMLLVGFLVPVLPHAVDSLVGQTVHDMAGAAQGSAAP